MRLRVVDVGLTVVLTLTGAVGCGKTPESGGPVDLKGGLQKGPFLLGSTVEVALLDASGNATGDVFNTTTETDLGDFELVVPHPGDAELIGTGFYFNEITGVLSDSSITIHALASVGGSGVQESYLNVVTHMGYRRALKLLRDGAVLTDSVAQAEEELHGALGIVHPGDAPGVGTSMNMLGGDTADNEYLFGVSCILGAAASSVEGSADANLQDILNTISLDLEDDGALDAAMIARLIEAERSFDPAVCVTNFQTLLSSKGSSAEVPDINQVWDTDKDGQANAPDPDDDGDTVQDADDCAPLDPTLQLFLVDGVTCVPDTDDDDSDGVPDEEDCAPLDPERHDYLVDGVTCVVDDDDNDDDGTPDDMDCAPLDPTKHDLLADGITCALDDDDDDNDGVPDSEDCAPLDPAPHVLLVDGVTCALDDEDDDDDGALDENDCAPLDPSIRCWTDSTSGLMWQDPPAGSMGWGESVSYCESMESGGYDDWRLPTISELRSFVRGWDFTMTDGACTVIDGCSYSCYDGNCNGCASSSGPGTDGCFWDADVTGDCEEYWSSSTLGSGINTDAFYVNFINGSLVFRFITESSSCRCVRGEIDPDPDAGVDDAGL